MTTFIQLAVEESASMFFEIGIAAMKSGIPDSIQLWLSYSMMLILYFIIIPTFYLAPIHKLF